MYPEFASRWRVSEWLLGLGLVSLALIPFFTEIEAHDTQRFITLGLAGVVILWRLWGLAWTKATGLIFVTLSLLGMISVALSPSPLWSGVEASLFVMLFILPFIVFPQVDGLFISRLATLMLMLQGGYVARYLWNYTEVLLNGYPLHAVSLIDGFSNIRFYGQFLVWTLPFCLAVLATLQTGRLRSIVGFILALSWAMAYLSGSRSFFVAMVGSSVILLWLTPTGWKRYTTWMLGTAALGFVLYAILVLWLPLVLGSPEPETLASYSAHRELSHTNGRWDIWLHTLQQGLHHPWFGLGPMMTAEADFFKTEAHPHNYLLQWFAEWGIPFTVLLSVFLGYQVWQWRRSIRVEPSIRETLAMPASASLGAALIAGLFDGLMVMPVSLAYLVVIAGVAVRLQQVWNPQQLRLPLPKWLVGLILLPTVGLSVFTFTQAPHIWETAFTQYAPHVRFWTDGTLPLVRPFAKNYGMGGASHTYKQAAVRLAIALQPRVATQQCQVFMGQTTQDAPMLTQIPDISLSCPQHREYLFFDLGQQLVSIQTHDLHTDQWIQRYFTLQDKLSLAEISEPFSMEALLAEKSLIDSFD